MSDGVVFLARTIAARSNPASSRSSVSGSVDYHPSHPASLLAIRQASGMTKAPR